MSEFAMIMNKRLVLLSCVLLVSVAAYAQYPYKWQIGGTMGMGGTIYTGGGDPTMSLKRRSSHPSVKVGRLAVSKKYQGQKWGEQFLSLLKEWFTHDNKTGCRYITVDSLRTAQGFYEKCGFKVLVTPEENDETVLMCYDLKQFISE